MGMSASQARLIALTARMNDIEYQGQQINQQRTTLSNQINALYNTLLDMDVPTPPSTSDFTKIEYSGTQNASKFAFGSVVPTGKNANGKDSYSIDFKYQMAGHAVAKNVNSATLTNSPEFLTYSNVNGSSLESLKSSLFSTTDFYKEGSAITSKEELPEADPNNPEADDILIKTTVADYVNNAKGYGSVYDINGNDISGNLPSDNNTIIYVKCNSADLKDGESPINRLVKTTGEGEEQQGSYNNVYTVNKESKDDVKSWLKDSDIQNMGLYYVDTVGDSSSAPKQITSIDQLKEYLGSGLNDFSHIFKKDVNGDKYKNPNYNSNNTTGLSVGDMPVLELVNAREALGKSYDDYITALRHSFPEYADLSDTELASKFYVYIEKSSSGSDVPHFIKKDEISTFNNNDATSVRSYEYDEDGTYEQVDKKENCELEFDPSTGRITRVGIPDGNGQVIWVDVKAETVTDTDAYEEAFNQYEYAKYKYDQEQQQINVKTSIIQAEDKNLELKLTRLDNERNAVNTEIEAVKKVVSDNIDKSFKTFSG